MNRTVFSEGREERGQALVLLVLTLTVLLGFAALTIDVGRAYYSKRALQASADAAALAGAQGLPSSASAQALAKQYSGGPGSKNERSNLKDVDTTVSIKCLGSGCSSPNAITVSEHARVGSLFAKVLGINVFDIGAKATACSLGSTYADLIDDNATSCPFNPGPCVIGYPYSSSNPRTSQTFNESDVLQAFAPQLAGPGDTIKVWYNDEHALTMGIRQVVVKTSKTASATTNYPIATLSSNPGRIDNPAVGSRALSGDQSGTDPVFRPMFPSLFITDLTGNPGSRAGDWQNNGNPIPPDTVFGTWKGAVKTIDKSKSPTTTTVTPDADPTKNNWNLGPGSDSAPIGVSNEGYGAEARWNVSGLGLQAGHAYRMQFMVHDGDQNKAGGDSGEDCMTVVIPH